MASAIDTATADPADSSVTDAAKTDLTTAPDRSEPRAAAVTEASPRSVGGGRGRTWRRPFSPLTLRILAVNVLALALLGGGFLYLGKYQASLVGQQIESLKTQGQVFAAALGEGAVLELG